jgi:CRP-like cAMP-binding protein
MVNLEEIERKNLADEISNFANRFIFKELSLNALKTLYLNCDVCDYRKLQYVYREGEKPDNFFIIKSGDFEVKKSIFFF